MTALAFDPWAALEMIRGGCPPAKVASPANPGGTNQGRLAELAELAGGHPPICKTEERQSAEVIDFDAARLADPGAQPVRACVYCRDPPAACDACADDWTDNSQ